MIAHKDRMNTSELAVGANLALRFFKRTDETHDTFSYMYGQIMSTSSKRVVNFQWIVLEHSETEQSRNNLALSRYT